MYGLCDCNNFFVSCERVFNPSLNGRPVVVLSNNDGCIIARSNEAKSLGIKMGQPLYQITSIVKKYDVSVLSSNYQLYGDMSERVMTTLKHMIPNIEIYSIDEAFLDFKGFDIDKLQELGQHISQTVYSNIGIPVSIGIAPTKTLAKIASKLCKKYPKLKGACLMYRVEDIAKVLSTFPIDDIWGIGRRYRKMLKGYGIETGEQFMLLKPEWVQSRMSVIGLRTWNELHGKACIEFEHKVTDKKSITVSRSFAKEMTTIESLEESLSNFVSIAAEKLRKQNSLAGQMQVYIFTNRHRQDQPQHYEGQFIQFPVPTDSTLEMLKAANIALRKLFCNQYAYKKAGITLYQIIPNKGVQSSMFDDVCTPKHKALMNTIDELNSHYGRKTIKFAIQGSGELGSKREHVSPSYTTDWNDIIVVKV